MHLGLTEVNFFEASIKGLAIQQSQKVALLADFSKFEQVSPVKVAELNEIDYIVTDDKLPPETIASYQNLGVEMVVARVST